MDQSARIRTLQNPGERLRTDIWWVDPDGGNAGEVARDIARSLVERGLPWFKHSSDLRNALASVEATHDCFVKFSKAALLAKRIGDHDRWRKYDGLAEAEVRRIGGSLDRATWCGV